MNLARFTRSGRRPGVLYFDDTPEGAFSREQYSDPRPRTAAERASDEIKARYAALFPRSARR
jgi:hypothetical protein